jgi:hypothetical protein
MPGNAPVPGCLNLKFIQAIRSVFSLLEVYKRHIMSSFLIDRQQAIDPGCLVKGLKSLPWQFLYVI